MNLKPCGFNSVHVGNVSLNSHQTTIAPLASRSMFQPRIDLDFPRQTAPGQYDPPIFTSGADIRDLCCTLPPDPEPEPLVPMFKPTPMERFRSHDEDDDPPPFKPNCFKTMRIDEDGKYVWD